jgi:hypothetical protein
MKKGVISQNKMKCFVRRKNGWMALPEDVSTHLQGCDVIANMTRMPTSFDQEDVQVTGENFTYCVEFNSDESVKSKLLSFKSGEKGEIFVSENGQEPTHVGFWQAPVKGFVRRQMGWSELKKDVCDWIVKNDEYGRPYDVPQVNFSGGDLEIVKERFSYCIEYHPDSSVKSKRLQFDSGEKCEVFLSLNERKPEHHGFWQASSRGMVSIDLTSDVD